MQLQYLLLIVGEATAAGAARQFNLSPPSCSYWPDWPHRSCRACNSYELDHDLVLITDNTTPPHPPGRKLRSSPAAGGTVT